MSILRCIEKVQKTRKQIERKSIIQAEYNKNRFLRMYLDVCYGGWPTEVKKLPRYQDDGSPIGLNLSNLEKQFTKFNTAMYSDVIDMEKRERLLTQICESVSKPEIELLRGIVMGKCKYFHKELYRELQDAYV